mgnify:CR=1 FL=1
MIITCDRTLAALDYDGFRIELQHGDTLLLVRAVLGVVEQVPPRRGQALLVYQRMQCDICALSHHSTTHTTHGTSAPGSKGGSRER